MEPAIDEKKVELRQKLQHKIDEKKQERLGAGVPSYIEKALKKYDGRIDIPPVEFCRDVLGMSESALKLVDMFWSNDFNNSWLYLSDEHIKEHLTDDKSKDAIIHFIERYVKKYKPNVEYKEVDKTHPLIRLAIPSTILEKAPANKKYFIILGKVYKKLLMSSRTKRGKITQDYFLEIESAMIHMKDYMMATQKIAFENRSKMDFLKEETDRAEIWLKSTQQTNIQYLNAFNCIYIRILKEKITIDGVDYPVFKLGESNVIMNRLKQHKTQYKNSTLLYINCVSNGVLIQKALKAFLSSNCALLPAAQIGSVGPKHSELFYTRPDFTIHSVIAHLHSLCLPAYPMTAYDKIISDLKLENKHNLDTIDRLELHNKQSYIDNMQENMTSVKNSIYSGFNTLISGVSNYASQIIPIVMPFCFTSPQLLESPQSPVQPDMPVPMITETQTITTSSSIITTKTQPVIYSENNPKQYYINEKNKRYYDLSGVNIDENIMKERLKDKLNEVPYGKPKSIRK